ncbi:MAG: hypothetical protein ACKPCP_29880 [Sphaerospermopsis kisseleviana]
MTVFVALIQIPYEGERFVGVYSTYAKAKKALLEVSKGWQTLNREANLVISKIQVDGEVVYYTWKVKPPQRQWKEW